VEVRHLDWFDAPHDEALNQLLSEHNMARVTIDTRPIRDLAGDEILAGSVYESLVAARERKPDVPVIPKRTADFIFIRYIGHPEIEVNTPYLRDWADYVASQLQEEADVYMFCHSPNNLAAPWLARRTYSWVEKQVSLASLPWETVTDKDYEQGQLF
jgi:uncharacterized protein YecE (DUF72 family)